MSDGLKKTGAQRLDETFSKFVRKHGNLRAAWNGIKSNGKTSSSPYVKDDIEKFTETEDFNIRSISARIQRGSYQFSKARGVPLEKAGKPGQIRPIVIPKAQDRVVQRTILDALVSDQEIHRRAFQPLSFGGVPKVDKASLAGVPAAIFALLRQIETGATHVMVADITGFFTRISKSECVSIVSEHTDDEKFLQLFEEAISIDLENCNKLWRHKDQFPYGDIGVGQGVCLSPFLGNLVLSNFDKLMNEGDCGCIRYVDDIIITAPNGKAASSRFRKAGKLLEDLGMEFASDKSSSVPIPVTQKFEYLGIEIAGGLLRPAPKSRKSILRRSKEVAAESLHAMESCQKPNDFKQEHNIPRTLNKISGMVKGWGHHYYFCNDQESISNVDRQINNVFLQYANRAQLFAQKKIDTDNPDFAAAFLGYRGTRDVKMKPFKWPSS